MKRLAFMAMAAACALGMWASTPREQLSQIPGRAGSNHFAYPYGEVLPVASLTPAPSGYEPFFINHYGRHGSRWLTGKGTYWRPVKQLAIAERHGALTAAGRSLLYELRTVANASTGRIGELSDVGAEQLQGIATRMMHNFPEVLSGDAHVEARSTVVIRCILSMQNETMTLRSLNPQLRITTDASYHDMHYMGWGYGEDTLANHIHKRMKLYADSVMRTMVNPERFTATLITDKALLRDSIDQLQLMGDVFDVAGSLQGHKAYRDINMYRYFTADEIYDLWRARNISWYVQWANAPQNINRHRMPFIERELLSNMVATADSAIATGWRGASLRFGHETCLLPLACLMELDSVNYSCADLSKLADHWQDYNIFPKGCNIQMVYYRRAGSDDVLVKVLLNEHEATLPVPTDVAPYYHWADLRAYYLKKLATKIDWAN